MYDDYAIDWLNIECQLSEALEYDTADEMLNEAGITRGLLGLANMAAAPAGRGLTKAALTVGKYGVGAPILYGGKAIAHDLKNYNPIQGAKNFGNLMGDIARSPMMKAGFWGNLLNKLKELWQRFKNIIASLFKTNNSFVNTELNNVEAIVSKAMSNNATANKLYQMTFKETYPFWMQQNTMEQIIVPPFNSGDKNMIQSLSDKNEFIRRYVRPLSRIDFNSGDCVQNVKNLFRGSDSPVNVRFDQIAPYIKQITNTCRNTNAYVNRLQQEHRQNEQAANEAMRKLEQMQMMQNGQQDPSQIAQEILAIRNYISISQLILGCKETVIQERYMHSVSIMRQILYHCNAASKQEIKNAEVNNYTRTEDPLEGMSKGQQRKAMKQDPEGSQKQLYVNDEYKQSLPDKKKKIEKEIAQIQYEKEQIEAYLRKISSKLGKNKPQTDYMKEQLEAYNKRLAILTQRYNELG